MARTALSYKRRRNWAPASAGVVLTLSLLLATPALLANGHTGTATPRTAPELSDLALFVMAVGAIWFTRRALRNRARKD